MRVDGWTMASTAPGTAASPADLPADLEWRPVTVPTTVAGARRESGDWTPGEPTDIDARDWWFRTDLDASAAQADRTVRFEGLAGLADVFVDGAPTAHVENMFIACDVPVVDGPGRLDVVCRGLAGRLAERRPRPRWKTRLVDAQHLRWERTSLLGRMPGSVPRAPAIGPWRPVVLLTTDDPGFVDRPVITTSYDPVTTVGAVTLDARLHISVEGARWRVGDHTGALEVVARSSDGLPGHVVRGEISVPDAVAWWPATHGEPHLYDTAIVLADGGEIALSRVGLRTIVADTDDGGFRLVVNGVDVFCRGACWTPPDIVGLHSDGAELRRLLGAVVGAGMNLLRLPGTGVYEQDSFYDLCDELGILVWQDLMFANMDYPLDDDDFVSSVSEEIGQLGRRVGAHPCLAVVCGGSEVQQQAAMMGLGHELWDDEAIAGRLRALVADSFAQVPFVTSSPTGGALPFYPSVGVAHYFGVGAYRRPLDDARRAGVRFASECLAFANVPVNSTIERFLDDGDRAPNAPAWKARVPRDRGPAWDFDDVRDHYVGALFGVDPRQVALCDPERYLDLGRAATHAVVEATMTEWRRPGSICAGAVVLQLLDAWPGAGWGIIDAFGVPKSGFHALASVSAPTAVLLTDEGLDGLWAHVVHDGPDPFDGELRVSVFGGGATMIGEVAEPVAVAPHDSLTLSVDGLFAGFRDLTYAYRFGPATIDVVGVDLIDASGRSVSRRTYLPGGHTRAVDHHVGLAASAVASDHTLVVTVSAAALAHYVTIDVPGFVPDTDWFHLHPGEERTITCRRHGASRPSGEVRALNVPSPITIRVPESLR